MGAPSREKRKLERESKNMAGRGAMVLSGVWTANMPGTLFKAMEKSQQRITGLLNDYRGNPTPDNWNLVTEAEVEFRKYWEPIHNDMNGIHAAPPIQQTTAKKK